jgi:hypothetical protein
MHTEYTLLASSRVLTENRLSLSDETAIDVVGLLAQLTGAAGTHTGISIIRERIQHLLHLIER